MQALEAAIVQYRKSQAARGGLDGGIGSDAGLGAAAEWGGMKASGLGREMGWDEIKAFTEVRSIGTNLG